MFSFGIITRATALVVFFPVVTCLAAKGQDGPLQCGDKIQAVALYSPESNLERSEMDTLNSATASIDIAMYSFTDRSLAEELVRLSRRGVRVRVYRDWREYEQERQRGSSTTELLIAGGVEVRVKSSQDLMHFKSYVIDGELIRTGSANWSMAGLKKQDNDVHYESDPRLAKLFESRFSAMWERSTNFLPSRSQN
jgi:phosphatidylserine/phosphatidylglycerophosphate/cardiolipin synthase-like enzyme